MKINTAITAFCITAMATLATAQVQTSATQTEGTMPPPAHGTVSNPRDTPMNPATDTLNEADRTFVKMAAGGGMFEVQSSQLAQTKASNDQIKSFAEKMIHDHTAANNELKKLADAKHVPVPATLDVKHASTLKDLQGLEGAAFDTAYVKAQIQAHREAVALFKKAAENCTDNDLKQFAAKTLPTLQQHMKMVKQLPGAEKLQGKKGNKKGKKKAAGQPAASNQ